MRNPAVKNQRNRDNYDLSLPNNWNRNNILILQIFFFNRNINMSNKIHLTSLYTGFFLQGQGGLAAALDQTLRMRLLARSCARRVFENPLFISRSAPLSCLVSFLRAMFIHRQKISFSGKMRVGEGEQYGCTYCNISSRNNNLNLNPSTCISKKE